MVKLQNTHQCHFIVTLFFLLFVQIETMGSNSKKVVAVGDFGCGKTSLLNVLSMDKAVDVNKAQILENEVIDVEVDGTKVALLLCSTAG